MPQHKKLLFALILAIILGLSFHPFINVYFIRMISSHILYPLGQIFLRMMLMVVVPLVVTALILAAYELGKSANIGIIAIKSLSYTVMISTISVIVGIGLINFIKPGQGINQNVIGALTKNSLALDRIKTQTLNQKSTVQTIIDLFPKNPLSSATHALDGELLPLIIFSLIFGLALSKVSKNINDQPNAIITLCEQVFKVCMRVIAFAISLAPIGIFALVFNSIFLAGIDILISLFFYISTVLLGLAIQQFIVYPFLLKVIARRNPIEFMKSCREVYLYAFSTSSSNATLPKALEIAEQKLTIPTNISRFVLTLGATMNHNGTALFEGITVLFLAQVYGIDLSLSQQINVALFSIITGIGTAGVPAGSLPLIMVMTQSLGIPPEGIGLIIGVDRFLDMCRTTINVSGDLVIAALVSNEKSLVVKDKAVA